MQPARRINHAGNLTWPQRKSGLLKGGLHVALSKVTQVTALPGAAAVGFGDGQVAERGLAALDARLVALDDLAGFVFGAGDFGLFHGEEKRILSA